VLLSSPHLACSSRLVDSSRYNFFFLQLSLLGEMKTVQNSIKIHAKIHGQFSTSSGVMCGHTKHGFCFFTIPLLLLRLVQYLLYYRRPVAGPAGATWGRACVRHGHVWVDHRPQERV
jgi:hypothetical protein